MLFDSNSSKRMNSQYAQDPILKDEILGTEQILRVLVPIVFPKERVPVLKFPNFINLHPLPIEPYYRSPSPLYIDHHRFFRRDSFL